MSKKEQPQQGIKREASPEEASYLNWRDEFLADPTRRAIYEEEAAKSELWLQLVEARQSAGLTQKQMAERLGVSQAQVARIEKEDYDSYTLTTLRKYVAALGDGFSLEVKIHTPEELSGETLHEPMTS
ncbi:MAG: XRE family transcriptional regulator [Anaerolineae bacterium]|nr:XRE family transcriptional regulator [Anaerolineae bacterium]